MTKVRGHIELVEMRVLACADFILNLMTLRPKMQAIFIVGEAEELKYAVGLCGHSNSVNCTYINKTSISLPYQNYPTSTNTQMYKLYPSLISNHFTSLYDE